MDEGGSGPTPAVLFRLEFGGANGWGHLVRSGALANELRTRGCRCDLWTQSTVEAVSMELREPFARVVVRAGDDARVPQGYDWLVVDHYDSSDELLRAWRKDFGGRILVIDDEARRSCDSAHLVLNARLGLSDSPYAPGPAVLLGEQYALLRSGLRDPIAPAWQVPAGVVPVLVMLGGTDPAGVTETVLEALADVDAAGLAPVVIRPGAARPAVLARFASSVWVDGVNARELAGWAGACRFAVSAAGGTLYELAALRLPFVAVVVAENQRTFAEEIEVRWGMPCVIVGSTLRRNLSAAVRRLLANLDNARTALLGIDGRGAERVAEAMTQGAG